MSTLSVSARCGTLSIGKSQIISVWFAIQSLNWNPWWRNNHRAIFEPDLFAFYFFVLVGLICFTQPLCHKLEWFMIIKIWWSWMHTTDEINPGRIEPQWKLSWCDLQVGVKFYQNVSECNFTKQMPGMNHQRIQKLCSVARGIDLENQSCFGIRNRTNWFIQRSLDCPHQSIKIARIVYDWNLADYSDRHQHGLYFSSGNYISDDRGDSHKTPRFPGRKLYRTTCPSPCRKVEQECHRNFEDVPPKKI